ncbi:NUDIX hydrolase [Clostridium sp.]|uniref:NUDIX hydrolase n=1 Tax=Clostridium sp. TaxID=1506 RepID=UPI003D6C7BCA
MINKLEQIFADRKSKVIGEFKESAVMILLVEDSEELSVIFEVRAHKLRSQPGDVCLPGGQLERDENPRETSIRETMEELNLKREQIQVIGDMDYYISPYGNIMYAFVGKLKYGEINPSQDEVDHIFKVPLTFFLENEPLLYKMGIGPINQEGFPFHLINGGKDYKFRKGYLDEYFYEYNGYIIWGFTAQIIKSFIDILLSGATHVASGKLQ